MTETLDLLIRAKAETDAALQRLNTGIETAKKKTREADEEAVKWTATQQRMAQRMEALHEEALKMNLGFKSADDGAELFNQTLGKATSIVGAHEKELSQLGAVVGVNTDQLKGLGGALDVTSLGFGQMTKSAAGFNAASAGVVGAGLAIGTTIGTLLRDIPAVAAATDEWAESVFRLAGVQIGAAEPAGFQTKMAAIQAQVQQNVVNVMRAQGKTTEEIVAQLTGKYIPTVDKVVDGLKREDEARKKAADAARRHAEELKKEAAAFEKLLPFMPAFERGLAAVALLSGVGARAQEELANAMKPATEITSKQALELEELYKVVDRSTGLWTRYPDVVEQELKNASASVKTHVDTSTEHIDKLAESFGGVSDILTETGNLFVALGGDADSTFARMIDGAAQLADSIGNVLKNLASGNLLGAIGAGIGGAAGLIGTIFGGQKEHKQVNDMRDAFVEAAGGITQLDIKARAAGMTLDRLLRAKNVKDYEAAVKELEAAWDAADAAAQRALDLQLEAQQKLQDAMERYGLTIEEMGPKFAQQELDKQAMQLFEDYELLTAAGADHNAVLSKMAPEMNEYVQTAISAGSTIPESMRPMIEQMIEMGLLTDENGVAFESLEESGLKFAESLEEGLGRTIDAIKELVEVLKRLYGMGPPDIPAPPGPNPNPHNPGDNGGEDHAGGWARITDWGVPAMLHGTQSNPEYVLRGDQLETVIEATVARALQGAMRGSGGGDIHVHNHIGGHHLDEYIVRRNAAGYLKLK